jgi:tetratricopeptide (TPR) repeat protein
MEALQAMLAADPANSFARYALAQEMANSGMLEEAVGEYETLMAANADYPAAYFHGGQALEKLGRIEEAAAMYRRGMEAASRTGDAHTRAELEAALGMLPL